MWGPPWSSVPLYLQATADVAGGLQGLRLRALSVGGLQGDGGQVEQGFRGCVQVWGWDVGHKVGPGHGPGDMGPCPVPGGAAGCARGDNGQRGDAGGGDGCAGECGGGLCSARPLRLGAVPTPQLLQ